MLHLVFSVFSTNIATDIRVSITAGFGRTRKAIGCLNLPLTQWLVLREALTRLPPVLVQVHFKTQQESPE